MLNPVDPTTTPAWKRLTELHDSMTPDLRAWFDHGADGAGECAAIMLRPGNAGAKRHERECIFLRPSSPR